MMRRYLACLFTLTLTLAGPATVYAQDGIACYLSCFNERSCQVSVQPPKASQSSQPPPSLSPLPLSGDTLTMVKACDSAKVDSGRVLVRYKRDGAWFSPPELPKVNELMADLFKRFPPDRCSVPTPDCLQARMSGKVAAIAGHGIDGQAAAPGGTGDPCRRGLPCGLVLAPQGAWRFGLTDAVDGQWQVRLLRGEPRPGAPKDWTAPVAGGVVTVDAQKVDAGRVYAYRLVDRSNAVLATGEFETVGTKRMEILQRLAQRRVSEGMPERAAWIDTLLNEELEWDAFNAVARN